MKKYIALEEIQKFPIRKDHYDKEHGNERFVSGIEAVVGYAECLPPADVEEVVHARWYKVADYKCRKIVECSRCKGEIEFSKKHTHIDLLPRCPFCGAYMDKR